MIDMCATTVPGRGWTKPVSESGLAEDGSHQPSPALRVIAAEQIGRRCFGVEMDSCFRDVALQALANRW